ncbi:MAG: prepilin-type N-terminal cleavage/methylation domain-containing protein [Desulfobacterales bacterium]|nr:prepilin-type N-terminal cleavage/methylation domain-containing protein [Desulfobacterales bacterium]
MSRPSNSAPYFGFTLLELMISLTIVGLIMVIIFGTLRIGVRAWEKGEQDVDRYQRKRIVLELLKRQLASTFVRKIKKKEQEVFLLQGDDKSMVFISHIPLIPGNQFGMVHVKYLVEQDETGDGECLKFYEENVVLLEKDDDLSDLDDDDFLELISGVESITFEYIKHLEKDDEEPEWQEAWDLEEDKGFPRAVKIVIEEDKDSAPINMIARIEPNFDKK